VRGSLTPAHITKPGINKYNQLYRKTNANEISCCNVSTAVVLISQIELQIISLHSKIIYAVIIYKNEW
jgi:hypothetical protein